MNRNNWYLTSKFALYITLSYEGHNVNPSTGRYLDGCGCFADGHMPESIDDIADHFDVEGFADAAQAMGVEYVNFTLYHAHLYTLCPNATLEARLPGHTSRRDVIRELLTQLHKRGIRMQLYIHATVGDTMTEEEREALHWYDSENHYKKWNDFFCDFFEELGARYGADMDSYYLDMIFDQPYLDMIHKERIRAALKKHHPNVVITGNGEANDTVDYSSREDCSIYVPDACERTAFPMQTVVLQGPKWWSTVPAWRESVARYSPGHLYKTLVLTAAANACGGGMAVGCGQYCDGGFEPGVKESLLALGEMLRPVEESIKGTLPSTSYVTVASKTIYDLPQGIAATRSADDRFEYLHVFAPSPTGCICLDAPLDHKRFGDAVLLNTGEALPMVQDESGLKIQIPANRDNLAIRLRVLAAPAAPKFPSFDAPILSATADSETEGHSASNVLAEDASFWLSQNGAIHTLTFDLGRVQNVCGIRMLPRQEGEARASLITHINAYGVEVSNDLHSWRGVATGEWRRSTALKTCSFRPIAGRYVRLIAGPDWLLDRTSFAASAMRVWIEAEMQ